MKFHLLSAALLATALVLEMLGFSGGGAALVGAGVACEVWFWIRLIRGRSQRPQSPAIGA
jgi:hypothetical protein